MTAFHVLQPIISGTMFAVLQYVLTCISVEVHYCLMMKSTYRLFRNVPTLYQ